MRRIVVSLILLGFALFLPRAVMAQTGWTVSSPDNSIQVTISQNTSGGLEFSVTKSGFAVVETSALGITASNSTYTFTQNLTVLNSNTVTINETYTLPIGKRSVYTNNARELTIGVRNSAGSNANFIFRAYNDGVAYRYSIASGISAVSSEESTFNLPNSATVWYQSYINTYEGDYLQSTAGAVTGRIGLPLLASINATNWVYLAEAVTDNQYAFFSLTPASGTFRYVPASDESLPIEVTAPFSSPWRVALIGTLANIVESTMVQNLNPQTTLASTSWIKPGRVAWSWWSDHASPSNLQIQKDYVDFAAEMSWEYILVDEGWSSSWIGELVNYGASKNVGIISWHFFGDFTQWTPGGWLPSYQNALSKFNQLKNWGVKGAKIDFFDSDSQIRTQTKEEIYRAAATSQMLFNFHGATLPRGEQRRYPNFLTEEGVKGAEHLNNNASHTTVLPFTRNVTGSMDYTPVTFSARGNTTYAHQLAQSIVYESAWQHYADSKETYRSISASELLKIVSTTWDETKLLAGYPADHVVIARRKGNDWFIGAMVNAQRNFNIPLNFLSGTYSATVYTDGVTATVVNKTTQTVTQSDSLTFSTLTGGGAAIHLQLTGTAASPSPSPTPCPSSDVNGDCVTDFLDLKLLLQNWLTGTSCGSSSCDLNQDGKINILDTAQIIHDINL